MCGSLSTPENLLPRRSYERPRKLHGTGTERTPRIQAACHRVRWLPAREEVPHLRGQLGPGKPVYERGVPEVLRLGSFPSTESLKKGGRLPDTYSLSSRVPGLLARGLLPGPVRGPLRKEAQHEEYLVAEVRMPEVWARLVSEDAQGTRGLRVLQDALLEHPADERVDHLAAPSAGVQGLPARIKRIAECVLRAIRWSVPA